MVCPIDREELNEAIAQARAEGYAAGLEAAAKYIEAGFFDNSVRLDRVKHPNLSDWFREQQASGIRALSPPSGKEG